MRERFVRYEGEKLEIGGNDWEDICVLLSMLS